LPCVIQAYISAEVSSPWRFGLMITVPKKPVGFGFLNSFKADSEPPQVRRLSPQRPRGEPHCAGDPDQIAQRGPPQRQIMTLAQCGQINPMAVAAGDHRQASKTAFGHFGLQNERGSAPDNRRSLLHPVGKCHDTPGQSPRVARRISYSGSSIHS